MKILESGAFDEIRKLQISGTEKKRSKQPVTNEDSREGQVVAENNRALNLALNDTKFEVNIEKVERLKNEIADGKYQPDTQEIAKELIKGENRGDFNLGLFSQ